MLQGYTEYMEIFYLCFLTSENLKNEEFNVEPHIIKIAKPWEKLIRN